MWARSTQATNQQRRRNNLYNQRVHGPTYKEGEHVLLQYPVVQSGKTPKLSSPCWGPQEVFKCLNDVNYKIKELTTGKVQVVHYDRMKRYHGRIPVASNAQTRQTTPLLATTHLHSPISTSHSVVKLLYLIISHHKWRHLAQVTAQLLRFHLQLLLLITSQIAPLQPLRLVFFLPRADVVYLHGQGLLTTIAVPHHPFQWSPTLVQLLAKFSLPAHLLRKQLSFSFPHDLTLSSMVLLTIFVSDSIVHHSRTVLQHSAPLWTTHLTFTLLLLLLTFRPHLDLCVVPPSSNVKRNQYSKPSFLETSRNFCLLRRSPATTGSWKITNNLWPILLL